jgi:protein arginine N-methyltransferase 1
MSCIKALALAEPLVDTVDPNQVVTDDCLLSTFDIKAMSKQDATFSVPFSIQVQRNDYIHAFVAFFDVAFNDCHKPVCFSTSPSSKVTHW